MSGDDLVATECDILIVGGGPVGLVMAIALARRGHRPILIEQTDGKVTHPRAGAVSIRTMEYFRRWGIAEKIRTLGFNPDLPLNQRFCTAIAGFELATAHYPCMRETKPPSESPETIARCRQMWMGPALAAFARANGAQLFYGKQLADFTERDSDVTCTIVDVSSGAKRQLRAQFLIACDGRTSTVRQHLGIATQGEDIGQSISVLFRSNLAELTPTPAERFIILSPTGPTGNITAMDGHDLYRYLSRGALPNGDVEANVRAAIGSADAKVEILSVRRWMRSQSIADVFQTEHVFLAGDAAHIMLPSGGFGANTGIGDAIDLAWKLDARLSGWGGRTLLDSYTIERRPVAIRNAAFAFTNHRRWTPLGDARRILDATPAGHAARAAIGRELLETTRAEWESFGVALGYAYENSPVIFADGSPPPPDDPENYVPSARPGHRAPHAYLADGRSTLDLFDLSFALLCLQRKAAECAKTIAAAAEPLGIPITTHVIDNAAISGLYEAALVLVRPDGHVAWRGLAAPTDPAALLRFVTGR